MIIELFGLPGAGKTTFARALSTAVSLPVVRLPLWKRILFWKLFALRSPKVALSGVWALFHHASDMRYGLFMNGCVDRYARFAYAVRYGGIVDEGPLQNVLSFPSRTLFVKEMDALVASLPHPDVLIHVSLPVQEREERQRTRGRTVRNKDWEASATENEQLALASLPPKVLVLEYPRLSIDQIVARIRAL